MVDGERRGPGRVEVVSQAICKCATEFSGIIHNGIVNYECSVNNSILKLEANYIINVLLCIISHNQTQY